MFHHQDQPLNSAYGGQGGANDSSSSSFRNRKCDKDGNFNFLPGKDDEGLTGNGGGDENRNQVRPRNLGPLGRDPPNSSPSSGYHHNSGILSPRSRLPCWSPLEPLPEIENTDDGYGRVPPDGLPELMDAVWTLRDRERFKAQEMEKHQVQLTMYRRLALIRWVRTLQGRIQEQQNRLQSSFDVILTHRKELLRMGAAAAVTNPAPTAAVGQS
uniref:Uncharacterized protein n=1 Tax=Seriola lalandi dorsalis TaxID=1841481 RepID=A0A3B4YB87_SERLL